MTKTQDRTQDSTEYVPFIDRCRPCQQYGAPAIRLCQTCGAFYFTSPVPLPTFRDLQDAIDGVPA